METWFYRPVIVDFMLDGKLTGVTMLDSARATHRGLRVGDSAERAHELYGSGSVLPDGKLYYRWAQAEQRAILITLRDSRVAQIFVGFLLMTGR